MFEVKKRYLAVIQKHSFIDKLYTLRWEAQCEYAPKIGEIMNVACLNGMVKYISHTISEEDSSLGLVVRGEGEVMSSALVWKTIVELEFGYKHKFDVGRIFEELYGAKNLIKIESFEIGEKSWSSVLGWREL